MLVIPDTQEAEAGRLQVQTHPGLFTWALKELDLLVQERSWGGGPAPPPLSLCVPCVRIQDDPCGCHYEYG